MTSKIAGVTGKVSAETWKPGVIMMASVQVESMMSSVVVKMASV